MVVEGGCEDCQNLGRCACLLYCVDEDLPPGRSPQSLVQLLHCSSSILKFRRMRSASWMNSPASQPSASPVKRGSFGGWMACHSGGCCGWSAMSLVVRYASTASRQLLYTVSWSVCDSFTSNPARSAKLCRGDGWGVKEAG